MLRLVLKKAEETLGREHHDTTKTARALVKKLKEFGDGEQAAAIMKHFGVDDYVIAAIELYLDVINLFLFLLQLLTGAARSNN